MNKYYEDQLWHKLDLIFLIPETISYLYTLSLREVRYIKDRLDNEPQKYRFYVAGGGYTINKELPNIIKHKQREVKLTILLGQLV